MCSELRNAFKIKTKTRRKLRKIRNFLIFSHVKKSVKYGGQEKPLAGADWHAVHVDCEQIKRRQRTSENQAGLQRLPEAVRRPLPSQDFHAPVAKSRPGAQEQDRQRRQCQHGRRPRRRAVHRDEPRTRPEAE